MGYFLFALERHADIKQMYEIGTKKLPDNLMVGPSASTVFGCSSSFRLSPSLPRTRS